jgi:hypothetical protein
MKKLSAGLVAMVICGLLAGNVFAQSEKVNMHFGPKPNQTSKLTNNTDQLPHLLLKGITIAAYRGTNER